MITFVRRIRFQYLGSIKLPLQDSVAKRDMMRVCIMCASQFDTVYGFIPKSDFSLIEKKKKYNTYSDKFMAGMRMKHYYGTSLKLIS